MTTTESKRHDIGAADVASLATLIEGPVLSSGEAGYAQETATWNLAKLHRPVLAVGATSSGDVQSAVRFANRHGLPIAVVATGHGAVVSADGALLINLRRMTGISIDTKASTATVGPGVEWQNMLEAAAAAGLAPLAGSSPNVGVVGYTLGGGQSPVLGRAYGFAADHVLAAEIVTADGILRTIDAQTEPDLFWAIRGGKGNFGVVTRLTFRLFPHDRLYGGGLFYTGEHVRPVLAAYRALIATAPDSLTASFAFLRLPDAPDVPKLLRGRFTLHVRLAYLGGVAEGERLIAGLRSAAPAILDTVADMPFTAAASIHADPVDPLPAYERTVLLRDLPDEAVEALIAVAGPDAHTPVIMAEVRHLGAAFKKRPEVPNATGNRDAEFQVFLGAVGAPGQEEALAAPLEAITSALGRWDTGALQPNFLFGYDTAPARVATAYPAATYERLRDVKRRYDPANLFRVNHNIPPR